MSLKKPLRDMTPEEAIIIWLEGAFTMGEEDVLAEVVKQGLSLKMSESDIIDMVSNCMVEGLYAKECIKRLTSVG